MINSSQMLTRNKEKTKNKNKRRSAIILVKAHFGRAYDS